MRVLLLVLAGLVVLAGCSTVPDSPGPSSTTTGWVAPSVANPKDARGITPCTLLTATQAMLFGMDPTRAKAGSTADLVDCGWPSTQPPISSVAVAVDTNPTRRGLTDTYLKRADFVIFEPLMIEGYPAVRAERVVSEHCAIYAGLSDTQAILVNVFAKSSADTCGLAKRIVAAVLANVPPQK